MTNIAFIGNGNMGKTIATNLIKKGYDLRAFGINEKRSVEIFRAGGNGAESIKEVATTSETIIIHHLITLPLAALCVDQKLFWHLLGQV